MRSIWGIFRWDCGLSVKTTWRAKCYDKIFLTARNLVFPYEESHFDYTSTDWFEEKVGARFSSKFFVGGGEIVSVELVTFSVLVDWVVERYAICPLPSTRRSTTECCSMHVRDTCLISASDTLRPQLPWLNSSDTRRCGNNSANEISQAIRCSKANAREE